MGNYYFPAEDYTSTELFEMFFQCESDIAEMYIKETHVDCSTEAGYWIAEGLSKDIKREEEFQECVKWELAARDIAPFGPSWPPPPTDPLEKAIDDLTDFVNSTTNDSLLGELATAVRLVLANADDLEYHREYIAELEGRVERLEQAIADAETELRESQPWGSLSASHLAVPDWGRRVLDAFDSGFDAAHGRWA